MSTYLILHTAITAEKGLLFDQEKTIIYYCTNSEIFIITAVKIFKLLNLSFSSWKIKWRVVVMMMKFFEEPDVIVPPDETHETPPEENLNEQTAFYPGPGEVRSFMGDAKAPNETTD